MMPSEDSQEFESYVPVYDAIPEDWEEAKPFLVENLKKISNAVNVREIGWYLDEQLLSGKQLFPGENQSGPDQATNQQFRTILRKVVDFGPIVIGVNSRIHGIVFDSNFTLIQLWASATDSNLLIAITFSNEDTIDMDATDINITSAAAYDRCLAVVEYTQEI